MARRADDSNTTYLCPPVGRARAGQLRLSDAPPVGHLVGRAAPLLAAGLGTRVTAVLGPRLLAKGFAAPRAEDPGTDARAEEAGFNYAQLILSDAQRASFFCHCYLCSVKFLFQAFTR